MTATLTRTELAGVKLLHRGKVRDVYSAGDGLLLVSTDRLSAFDCILPTPIPDKGRILTQLSAFWFRWSAGIMENHLLTTDPAGYPPELRPHAAVLAGRSMLVRRAHRVDVECVVRGHLAGSAWAEYQATGAVFGQPVPAGLAPGAALPQPLFTPTTKADQGHDQPLYPGELEKRVGAKLADELREASLRLYRAAHAHALERGIILADTKFEFGRFDGRLIVIDEMLTPDSSRFWDARSFEPGRVPENFDKQYVRDHLTRSGWNKEPPAPPLPDEVVRKTRERYLEAFRRITGEELP